MSLSFQLKPPFQIEFHPTCQFDLKTRICRRFGESTQKTDRAEASDIHFGDNYGIAPLWSSTGTCRSIFHTFHLDFRWYCSFRPPSSLVSWLSKTDVRKPLPSVLQETHLLQSPNAYNIRIRQRIDREMSLGCHFSSTTSICNCSSSIPASALSPPVQCVDIRTLVSSPFLARLLLSTLQIISHSFPRPLRILADP